MKKTITFPALLVLLSASVVAQPVLVSTMAPFPVGTTDSVYTAANSVAPGSAGAGVTWNLAGLTPVAVGTVTIITPSSSPYFTSFPTTTFCAKLQPVGGGAVYVYERQSATRWEQLANNYAGPGTGTDYTPNPESSLEFPMSYTNSFTDTFQKVSGSANTVDVSYDGYGTLITPFGTYTDVVRIKKYWGVGDYAYNWYTTAPFGIVAVFDAQDNAYTLIRQPGTTGINEPGVPEQARVFPNPLSSEAVLITNAPAGLYNASVILSDATGRVMLQLPVTSNQTTIRRGMLSSGIYFYQFCNNGLRVASGKLIIE